MPRPRKQPRPSVPDGTPAPGLDSGQLDALLGGRTSLEEVDAIVRQMKKALYERILSGELTHHLGYGRGDDKPAGVANQRNGSSPKTVLSEDGPIPLAIPRDRDGSFAPQLIPKNARRLPKFDAHVLSLYAHGLTMREMQEHLREFYGVEIATECIRAVTDEVLEEVTQWQQRPLEACYPVVIFDAMVVKIRDEGVVRNKAVCLALGITPTGAKDVLGLWIEQTEGARFWHRVMTELQARGVQEHRPHPLRRALSRSLRPRTTILLAKPFTHKVSDRAAEA